MDTETNKSRHESVSQETGSDVGSTKIDQSVSAHQHRTSTFANLSALTVKSCKILARISRMLGETVYLTFNGIGAVAAPVAIFMTLGITGTATLIDRITSGEYPAMTLAVASMTALMGGSLTVSFFSLKNKLEKHFENMEVTMDRTNETLTNEQYMQSAIARLLHDIKKELSFVSENISRQEIEESSVSLCTPNQAATWSDWARNTRYIVVGGIAQSDVKEYRDGEGQVRFSVDEQRLKNWLPRFIGNTKLARVDHVFVLKSEDLKDGLTLSNQLKRVMAAYKGSEQIAENSGLRDVLDFSKVNVHLMSSEYQITNAFFVGKKEISTPDSEKEVVPVVIRYDALGHVISSVTALLEPKVHISFDQDDAKSCERLVDSWLPYAARTFTMRELLDKYGDQVSVDECDYELTCEDTISLNLPTKDDVERSFSCDFDIVDLGDGSFKIVERN
ncbi:MAG: hypothetical protein AAF478_04740 [Pseudomonadota bacterium]